jgi:hypothetical protein
LDLPELKPLYSVFCDVPVVSISDAQRAPLPQAHYIGTVPHGLPEDLLLPGKGAGGYLAFLGRISPEKAPEKAPDRAIRIAGLAGMELKIAAKIDRVDQQYFKEQVEPLLSQPHVEFVGEINDAEKSEFLGNAVGLLLPIAWREPFGMAMIEAMACGTPVLARRNGSVPEVVDDGVTGLLSRAKRKLRRLPDCTNSTGSRFGKCLKGTVNLSVRVSRMQATGSGDWVHCKPMPEISAQIRNFWVLEALCSAAVT